MAIDLERLYNAYLHGVVRANPKKYPNFEALEKDITQLYTAWESAPAAQLNGKTPKQFVEELREKHELCDYIQDLLEAGAEVSDIAAFELLKDPCSDEFLAGLCYSEVPDAASFSAEMLKLKGGKTADDCFIDALLNPNAGDKLKLAAYEYLSADQPQIVDVILEMLPALPEDKQGVFVEILSEYKNNKAIYFWLVTMLYRREDIVLYADLLAKYDDPAAVPVINGFVKETDDINYMEYLELRYAAERLGGELEFEKDFSNDPLYKYQRPDGGVPQDGQ